MAQISSLVDVFHTLDALGFETVLKDRAVAVQVGGLDKPFTAVVTHNQMTNHFQITCLIANLGRIGDRNLAKFAFAALDANSRIAPFAYALMTHGADEKDDDEKEWPIVLMHSLPVGDLSSEELDSAMKSLVAALMDSAEVLKVMKK